MNIEEARKVLWLPNNRRPLGELIDEGYLNRSRLEWASRKAYDPLLKQAARVILEHIGQSSSSGKTGAREGNSRNDVTISPLSIGMTLESARKKPWPFPPYKGRPMGELVESKQLSIKDLGYAIDNAWNKDVRQAAITLMLVRLEQAVKEPEPPAGYVRVVSGGPSYSRKRQLSLALLQGIIFGAILSLGIYSLWQIIIEGSGSRQSGRSIADILTEPHGFVVLIIALLIILAMMFAGILIPNWIVAKLDKKIDEYRLGEEGEEKALQMAVQALDGNWEVFRNVRLPGRHKGDLDIILVGPPGVWVLEVKNYRGQYRNIGDNWEYLKNKKWKNVKSPGLQARKNAARLGNFLRADRLNIFVNAVVVWANDEHPPLIDNPSTAVWICNRLPDELGNIWQGNKLSDAEQNLINEKLQKLCQPKNDPVAKPSSDRNAIRE